MLYRLNERDWEGMRYVFCDRAEMERVCDEEEIEDREAEEIEVSDDVVQLLKETAHETLDMGEGLQEVFDGVASAYINRGRELVNFIEYLREAEFDDLAERWESFTEVLR